MFKFLDKNGKELKCQNHVTQGKYGGQGMRSAYPTAGSKVSC